MMNINQQWQLQKSRAGSYIQHQSPLFHYPNYKPYNNNNVFKQNQFQINMNSPPPPQSQPQKLNFTFI